MIEKNFTNAILLSATVVVAFMIIYPPIHSAAQNKAGLDEHAKVRKVIVDSIDFQTNRLVVHPENDDSVSIKVVADASTTVYFGNGDETELPAIKPGANVYVFGSYDKNTKEIGAEKIVVRNRRITGRTQSSRADSARTSLQQGLRPNTPDFNLLGTASNQ